MAHKREPAHFSLIAALAFAYGAYLIWGRMTDFWTAGRAGITILMGIGLLCSLAMVIFLSVGFWRSWRHKS